MDCTVELINLTIFTTSGEYVYQITAPDDSAVDRFGRCAGISDNVIVIGAHRDDDYGSSCR